MSAEPLATRIVAKVAEDYRRRGYEVDIAPSSARLPEFLAGFQPDLIARGPSESVVVEVKVGTRTSVAERLRDVAERVNREPGWRFSLVFASPDEPDEVSDADVAPLAVLEARVRNAEGLFQAAQSEAAFLLFWSALEGLLRLLGRRADLPLETLPPSMLIRELYSAGELSREQFESLLRLLPVRNRLVHGVGAGERLNIEELQSLVRALLSDARSPRA